MIKRLFHAAVMIGWIWAAGAPGASAEGQAPPEGAALPSITLSAPKDPEQVAYLGIGGRKTFTVGEVAADIVIIEIFNMY